MLLVPAGHWLIRHRDRTAILRSVSRTNRARAPNRLSEGVGSHNQCVCPRASREPGAIDVRSPLFGINAFILRALHQPADTRATTVSAVRRRNDAGRSMPMLARSASHERWDPHLWIRTQSRALAPPMAGSWRSCCMIRLLQYDKQSGPRGDDHWAQPLGDANGESPRGGQVISDHAGLTLRRSQPRLSLLLLTGRHTAAAIVHRQLRTFLMEVGRSMKIADAISVGTCRCSFGRTRAQSSRVHARLQR